MYPRGKPVKSAKIQLRPYVPLLAAQSDDDVIGGRFRERLRKAVRFDIRIPFPKNTVPRL